MLIKKISSLSAFFLALLTLHGCASTPPNWFTDKPKDTDTDYITVSRGLSMHDAKQRGMMQITQKLSSTLDVTTKMRDAGIVINTNGEDETRTYGYIDTYIKSTTAKLSLNGIQVVESEENDSGTYVKLKVSKASINMQMENELRHYEEKAQAQLNALQSQDELEWWIQNRNITQFIADVETRISILAAVNPGKRYDTPISLTYADMVARVKNSIQILISAKNADAQKQAYLADFISQQGIVTTKNRARATHIINLASTHTTGRVGKYHRYTSNTDISVASKEQQKIIASNKIVSTGSSPTSIAIAKTGDTQDFSKQIKDSGLWKFLGFSIK